MKLSEQTANPPSSESAVQQAGCPCLDIRPNFPVLVNGGFLQNQAIELKDSIRAKAIVLDDESLRLGSLVRVRRGIPRDLIDRARRNSTGKAI